MNAPLTGEESTLRGRISTLRGEESTLTGEESTLRGRISTPVCTCRPLPGSRFICTLEKEADGAVTFTLSHPAPLRSPEMPVLRKTAGVAFVVVTRTIYCPGRARGFCSPGETAHAHLPRARGAVCAAYQAASRRFHPAGGGPRRRSSRTCPYYRSTRRPVDPKLPFTQ